MSGIIVGGIEGGGTHSTLVLMNKSGEVLAKVVGPHTNHWSIGMPECRKRISEMVKEGKKIADIPQSQRISSLGLCLSGCGQEESNKELWTGLMESHSDVSERYAVYSDTDGSVATVTDRGGMVLISGTGSNCLLINPDGSRFQVGGWGHMLGDEGSAYWIALRAVKYLFDDHDGLSDPPYPTSYVWRAIQEHFQVETRCGLLDHCYRNFKKHRFASLCLKLSEGAKSEDRLCKHLFWEAGEVLAAMVLAQVPRAARELVDRPGGLNVLCVGSVWKSWNLLQEGFVAKLQQDTNLMELSLTRLTTTAALGAAYLAADRFDIILPKTYDENHHVFFHYVK